MESKTIQQKNSYFTEDGFVIVTPFSVLTSGIDDNHTDTIKELRRLLDEWKILPWFKYIQENSSLEVNSQYDTSMNFSTFKVEKIYRLRWKLTKKQHTFFMIKYGEEWKNCQIRRFT